MRASRVLAFCLLLSQVGALPAFAEPFHYQSTPLGERAVGMGGAFTGVANEPSAAYYNPAGLVRLEDTSLSAGLTLVALDRYNVRRGYQASGGSTSLEHNARPSLPLFVSFVKQIGARDDADMRRHAIAFSTFTLDRRSLGFDAKIDRTQGATRTIDTLYVQHEYETLWHGASYAYRLSDEWTLGASLFLSLSRMSNVEERLALSFGENNGDGTWRDPELGTVSRRTSNNVKNLVARLGVLYARSRWRFGAMLQPKSVHLSGKASVREREALSDATQAEAVGTYFERSDDKLDASEPFPWELRVGASHKPRGDLTVAADFSVYSGSRDNVVSVGLYPVDRNTDHVRSAGTFIAERWKREPTANMSVGAEYLVWDAVIFRGGLFSDLSSAPDLPKTSTSYKPADVNRFGAGFSVGLVDTGFDLSLGLLARVGRGEALAYRSDNVIEPYERTAVRERTLFVFLTGVRRVVGKLTDVTVEKIQRFREDEKQTEGSSDPEGGVR